MSLYSQIFVDDFAASKPPALAAGLSTRRAPRTLRGVRAYDPLGHGVVARRGRFAGEKEADTSGLPMPKRSRGRRSVQVQAAPMQAYPGPPPFPTDVPAPAGAPPPPSEDSPSSPSPSSGPAGGSGGAYWPSASTADRALPEVPQTDPALDDLARRFALFNAPSPPSSLPSDPVSSPVSDMSRTVEQLRVRQNTFKERPAPASWGRPPVVSPPLVARPDVHPDARLETPTSFPTVSPPVTTVSAPLDLFPAPEGSGSVGKAVSSWKQTAKQHLRTLADEGKTALRDVAHEAGSTVRSHFEETKAQLKADAQAAVKAEIDELAGKATALKDRAQAAVGKKAQELKGKALKKTEELAGKAKTAVTSKAKELTDKARTAAKAKADELGTKAKTVVKAKTQEAGAWIKRQGASLGKKALAGAKEFVSTAWPTGGGGTKAVTSSSAAPNAVKVPPTPRPPAAVAPGPAKKVPNYVPVSVPKPNLRTGGVKPARGAGRKKAAIAVAAA